MIMTDANQAWSRDEALDMLHALEPYNLTWLEEPIAADSSHADWQALLAAAPMALAGGENLRGEDSFAAATYLRYVQPDVIKWGGISATYRVARAAVERGQIFCPHYLAGAVGLYTSAHLLAAVGGGGLLEVDVNPNPLRTELLEVAPRVVDGSFVLTGKPGIGVDPNLERAQAWRVEI
jgi:L-alanine-DL-glutamate epimerase-like enolase superfamily enzyme